MPVTNFKNGISSFGMTIYGTGGAMGVAMGRSYGLIHDPSNTKVFFVDSAATGKGTGKDWKNAFTTVQEGVNAARYNTAAFLGGSPTYLDINYDDERQVFVCFGARLDKTEPAIPRFECGIL